MRVLVVNAGSSSLKLSLLDDGDVVEAAGLSAPSGRIDEADVQAFIDRHEPPDAVGHRIVHGGTVFRAPVVVDDDVVRRLDALTDLAPLHQPKSLRALRVTRRLLPDVPAVACFDTAFHATIPDAAATYALPAEWRLRWPLRKFGFHGLSHSYAARRAAELIGRAAGEVRVVSCHLGAGASLCAVDGGRSVETTMGFTPLDGLVMATRSGSVDPGLILWLEEHVGMPSSELAATLERRSGLLALAGAADMAVVLAEQARGEPRAVLAVDVYVHRVRAAVAAMAAAMGGLDVLSFTGGVGEHAAAIRRQIADGLAFLGVAVDQQSNAGAVPDAEITAAGSPVHTVVLTAREDLEITRQVAAALSGRASGESSATP